MQKRAACFFATPCGRGCSIRANYQSTTVHLPPALDTGNLDIVTDAMVRTVNKRPDGKAEGVIYIDRKTGAEHRVKARVVVLAASALESVRILLNSGVANGSGKVGKYIMDTVGANFSGQVPLLENLPLHNEDGVDGLHLYTPWWLYKEQLAGKLGFARGYHFEFGGGRTMPGMGTAAGLEWLNGGTYGKKFKEDARRYYGSFVGFAGRGEMIPNDDCYAELDPKVKDKFGIPVLRFHWKWSQHELGQAAHMQKTAAEIIDAMGGRYSRAAAERRQGHQAGRHHHPRSRRRHHGQRPEEIRDQQLRPVLGHEEPVHHRRRDVVLERRQEPDAHDHGARLARVRSHARPHEEEGAMSLDRRTTIKWMFAAAATVPSLQTLALSRASRWRATSRRTRRATAPIPISRRSGSPAAPGR